MPAAARVDPRTFFSPSEWAPLARRSRWKGLALLAHAWGVIFAAAAMAVVWPLTLPLAVVLIGGRQLGGKGLSTDIVHASAIAYLDAVNRAG